MLERTNTKQTQNKTEKSLQKTQKSKLTEEYKRQEDESK